MSENIIKHSVEIEDLKAIHYKIRELIEGQKWKVANDYIKTIMYTGDVNKMNMILIATQALVNHVEIRDSRYKLYQRFNNEMGRVYLEWPIFKDKDKNVPENG